MSIRILFVFLAGLMFASSAAAQQTEAEQRAQREQEFAQMFIAARSLSSCPALIDGWEYEIIDRRLYVLEDQLAGDAGIPFATKHQLNAHADTFNCDDATLKSETINFRSYAAIQWLQQYRTYEFSEDCHGPLLTEEELEFFEAFEPFVLAEQSKIYGETLGATLDINAARLAPTFNQACRTAFQAESLDALMLEIQLWEIISAPREQYGNSQDSEHVQERSFDAMINHIALRGEKSAIALQKARGFRGSVANYASVRGECSGQIVLQKEYLNCSYRLERDGAVTLELDATNIGLEAINGVRLEIIDQTSGEVVQSFDGAVPDNNSAKKIVFADMKQALEATAPRNIVKFTFDLTFDGKQTGHLELPRFSSSEATRGTAVVDLLKAYEFAYAPYETDLTYNGESLVAKVSDIDGER